MLIQATSRRQQYSLQNNWIGISDEQHAEWMAMIAHLSDQRAKATMEAAHAKLKYVETHVQGLKLAAAAENCKHILSTLDTSSCYVESLYDGMDFSTSVTRARFDNELSKVK